MKKAWLRTLVFLVLLLPGCVGGREEPVREIHMITRQFEFDPPEIRVKQGERVRLTVESVDVAHGFGVLEWNVSRQVLPGQPLVLELNTERAGTFQIICTVFCGTGHANHKGTIVVEGR